MDFSEEKEVDFVESRWRGEAERINEVVNSFCLEEKQTEGKELKPEEKVGRDY